MRKLHLKKGDKVKYLYDYRYDYGKMNEEKYLKRCKVYTVDLAVVCDFRTVVFLKEFPSVTFNSVHFKGGE